MELVSEARGRDKKAFINQCVTIGFDSIVGLLYNSCYRIEIRPYWRVNWNPPGLEPLLRDYEFNYRQRLF